MRSEQPRVPSALPLAGAVGACVLLSRVYAVGMPLVREVRPNLPPASRDRTHGKPRRVCASPRTWLDG
jgi:hypothetical protein